MTDPAFNPDAHVGDGQAGRGADGDWPPTLAELFRTEQVALVRLAYLLTGRRAVAEDVVQDAFIKTRRVWSDVRNPASYLRTAVVNGCRSWGRHQAVIVANRPDPPEPVLQEPDELWDALGRLDERRRTAIVLRYYLNMRHTEIAEMLDCPAVTVRTSIHRGLAQLRQEIQK